MQDSHFPRDPRSPPPPRLARQASIPVAKPRSPAFQRGSAARQAAMIHHSPPTATRQSEEIVAKGQMKSNKEAKKPKADKSQAKTTISAYKQSQSKAGQATAPFAKKT